MPRFPRLAACCVLALLSPASIAGAADPEPFAGYDATCEPADGPAQFVGAALTEAQPDVLLRYAAGGPITIDGAVLGSGDVIWDVGAPLAAGDEPSVIAACEGAPAPTPFDVAFLTVPAPPATFAGMGGPEYSQVAVLVPERAPFVADVTVTGGKVGLQTQDGVATEREFSGAGQYDLGMLDPGTRVVRVTPKDDTRPSWRVTIRRKPPVTLSAFTMRPLISRTTGRSVGSFTVDGQTQVTATVTDKLGRMVGWLLSGGTLPAGTYPLAWDARAANEDLVDGTYRVHIRSNDITGAQSAATADVVVDRTAPRATIRSANRSAVITPSTTLQVRATDDGTGLARAAARLGATAIPAAADGRTFTLRPKRKGWPLGRHEVVVTAADLAGNTTTQTVAFTVVEALGAGCGTAGAKSAVLTSEAARKALARAAAGRDPRKAYRVRRVVCADLIGDRSREMTVLLAPRAGRGPTPLLTFRVGTDGMYAPRLVVTNLRVRALRARGRAVRVSSADGDALAIRERGGRLVLRALRGR